MNINERRPRVKFLSTAADNVLWLALYCLLPASGLQGSWSEPSGSGGAILAGKTGVGCVGLNVGTGAFCPPPPPPPVSVHSGSLKPSGLGGAILASVL